jgi:hypothetical protein
MVQLSGKSMIWFCNGQNKMAAKAIRKQDIFVRFPNGPLAWTILDMKKFIKYFSFVYNGLALWTFENRTRNRMVKDHLKTGHKYVWFSNVSGIWTVTVRIVLLV